MKFSSVLLAAGTAHGDLYKVYEPNDFHRAMEKCQAEGGNIPLPLDEKENQEFVDFLKKQKLTSAWLSVSNSHSGYFSSQDNWEAPDYMNWEHEKPRNGPFVGLAKTFKGEGEEQLIPNKMAIIGEQTSWYDQPADAKNSFICMKPANVPEGEQDEPMGNHMGLRPMIFIGPPMANEQDSDENKERCGGKDWRYTFWENEVCWKFIKEQMTFPKAWAKCKGMGGYLPCPRNDWGNNDLNEMVKKWYTTVDSNGLEKVDDSKLKSIKMIWLGIKKAGDKWICKDQTINLDGYEGFLMERPVVKYMDEHNKGTRVDFKKNNIYHGNGTIETDVMAFMTRSVINPEGGKWKWAMNEQVFDTVCEFKKAVTADEMYHNDLIDGQDGDSNGAIFIPKGEFNFWQAKQACANQDAKMYAPETKLQRTATMNWFNKYMMGEQAKLNAHWGHGFNNRMPGHFDGNAPTVAPTLFGEDLPWLGFHFDTETVMFKKLYEDTPKGPPTKGSTKLMPKIQFTEINKRSNWKDFTKPGSEDESTFCCGWPWKKPASYPRYDMYASLRFKQSYTWYTNSGGQKMGLIHENLFWMSTNIITEMKVLCEQFDPSPGPTQALLMIPEEPAEQVVCEGVEGFEPVEIGPDQWICLHFNIKQSYEWPDAKRYCEKTDPHKTLTGPRGRMWYPHSEEEQRRVGKWLVQKMKEGDIQHKIDQCADATGHCYASSIWDDKSHYSWELNQTTGLVWIGGSMNVEPNDGKWYNSGYNRDSPLSKDDSFEFTAWDDQTTKSDLNQFSGPAIKRKAVVMDSDGKYMNKEMGQSTRRVFCQPNEPPPKPEVAALQPSDKDAWTNFAEKNKALLTKGCISPFHLTPELKEHLFNLGGEWKFIPDKKGLNKGIKFADPIVLTPENTEWPEKADYKAKTTWIKQKGSWTMMGCKKRGQKKCNKIKPPKAVMMQTKGTLQFSCDKKTMKAEFKCIKLQGVNNLETCKKGANCLKGKGRVPKNSKNHPWPFLKKAKAAKGAKTKAKTPAGTTVQFGLGWNQLFKGKLVALQCK